MVDRHWWHFKAVPANALVKDGWHLAPAPELWVPLMDQLRREHKEYIEGEHKRSSDDWESIGLGRPPVPDPPVLPNDISFYRSHTCDLCGRKFHRLEKYYGRYCSDACAEEIAQEGMKRRISRQTAAKSKKRAEARADRVCQSCGESIEAARSSKRYCSDRSRVAAHRAAR
jgi:hypothetical protein